MSQDSRGDFDTNLTSPSDSLRFFASVTWSDSVSPFLFVTFTSTSSFSSLSESCVAVRGTVTCLRLQILPESLKQTILEFEFQSTMFRKANEQDRRLSVAMRVMHFTYLSQL